MKLLKYFVIISVSMVYFSCTKEIMDDVNENLNQTANMSSKNLIPDAITKTAYETSSTDIAWYTSVYIEHNAGTWGQFHNADFRQGQTSSSLFDNSWNNLYTVMNICKTIMDKTDPISGDEKDSYFARGLAHILMAYNLAVATDMWGEIPYDEAFKGLANLKPAYQNQSVIYPKIQNLLDTAIASLNKARATEAAFASLDMIYQGDRNSWIRAAYSLKARYYLRLSKRDPNAAANALTSIANGFSSQDDEMIYDNYNGNTGPYSPWAEFWYYRFGLSVSETFENILTDRNDPRFDGLIYTDDGGPAPSGAADQVQSGYDVSLCSTNDYGWSYSTPMMTYHELKFIEAEALFLTGDPAWATSLEDAIAASFDYISSRYYESEFAGDAATYYTEEVEPLLTSGNELNEILTQKYISLYEFESIEAYNDYRRTGVPVLNNPFNVTVGFVNRFPTAYSEVSNNPNNIPSVNVYSDKVWWAGGDEKK